MSISSLLVCALSFASTGFVIIPRTDTLLFTFDRSDEEFNPDFFQDGFMVRFSTDRTVNPAGVVQYVNDARAVPFSGIGNLRLTERATGPAKAVAVIVNFSTPVHTVELKAFQIDMGSAAPLVVEAFASSNALGKPVDSARTKGFASPPYSAKSYETLILGDSSLTRVPPFRSLRITGVTNASYFDDLTALIPLPTTDLVAGRLEVTQAVQDLNNSVRLVRDKDTFVRFHATSTNGSHLTFAQLHAQRGSLSVTLNPVNGSGGQITIGETPDRAELNDSFLFHLPSNFRVGTVTLTATLNPVLSWRGRSPREFSYLNNSASDTVAFESVPDVNMVVYRMGYKLGGTTYYPPTWQRNQMLSWIRRAYPLSQLNVWNRTHYMGSGLPDCDGVNAYLMTKKVWDLIGAIFGTSSIPMNAHYYGMVDDRGDFMRGCALDIPSFVASGPTGTGGWADPVTGWDDDGSYGDWYGGHEMAHTYGRPHANFCGASGGSAYPYGSGGISPASSGNTALYGFDILDRRVYEPSWKDVMTYCDYQWMSDFTYEALMNTFQGGGGGGLDFPAGIDIAGLIPGGIVDGGQLMVVGSIRPSTNEVKLQPVFRVPSIRGVQPQGKFMILLKNAKGSILARHPFEPSHMHEGPGPKGSPEVDLLFFSEMVAFADGSVRLEILNPDGKVLREMNAGPTPPSVKLLSPNGGEKFGADDSVTVAWESSDPERDPLAFNLQYSPDGGKTWDLVAQSLQGNSAELDAGILIGGKAGLLRIWASDGLNSSYDDSDGPFFVANHIPEVEITTPVAATTVAAGQTVLFIGDAYDIDTGTMPPEQLEWISSIDGPLGDGSSVSVATLSVGAHTIFFRANDGQGGLASDSVAVTVVEDPTELPEPVDGLMVDPSSVEFDVSTGETNALIDVLSTNPAQDFAWAADPTPPWLKLSAAGGQTPSGVVVEVDPALLPGDVNALVTFRRPEAPAQTATLKVRVNAPQTTGAHFRRGDSNGDRSLDIGDPIFTLACLFQGGECSSCPDAEDADDNGALEVTDPVYTLLFSFLGGPALRPPFAECGTDPTADRLGDCRFPACE